MKSKDLDPEILEVLLKSLDDTNITSIADLDPALLIPRNPLERK